MGEWLREAIETDRWDDVDVNEAPDVSDVYADYQLSKDFD